MKHILTIAMIGILLSASACKSRTEYGECIGMMDNQVPGLQYKLSVRNIVIGGLFWETVFVPIIVALTQYECPVAKAGQ